MSEQLQKKIVDAIVDRETNLYDVVYLYGNQETAAAMTAALEEEYTKKHPHAGICRTDADSFREETRKQIPGGEAWGADCDLFIFENIDGIAGLEINEQRLYGILDWLLENRRQILVTGTVPTVQILTLAPRIRAQIDGGIAICLE